MVAGRADFGFEQWATMRSAVIGAAVLVSMCEGGREDMVKETLAITGRLRTARLTHPSQLIRELADIRYFRSGLQPGMSVTDFEAVVMTSLREACAAIRSRAPEELPHFRAFVLHLAGVAAGVHREGGFMGVGGSPVSPAEAAAIGRIAAALGPDGPPPRPDRRRI